MYIFKLYYGYNKTFAGKKRDLSDLLKEENSGKWNYLEQSNKKKLKRFSLVTKSLN